MHWQAMPHVILLVATAAISAALAYYAWQHRPVPGGTPFTLLMLAVAEWALTYALELGSVDSLIKVFWIKVEYVGIVSVPVAWLAFALQYTGREKWLTRRTVVLLGIVPLITLLLVFTTETHGLMWSSVVRPEVGRQMFYGAWFWVAPQNSVELAGVGSETII
jgi:4-amino-4-deoxy-L-arabinose transferase-like glycosyltransferase